MKSRKWKIGLALMAPLSLAACSAGEEGVYSSMEIYSLLSEMAKGYHVEGELVQVNEYSGDYALNTFTSTYTINRDYGVLSKNGVDHDAVSVYSGDNTYTYYRGDLGKVTGDFYDYKNEVISEVISLGLSSPYFDNKYLDPFDFITYKDFDESLNLDIKKAAFMLEQYFGVTANVESTSFVRSGSQISLDWKIRDKTCAFDATNGIEEYEVKSTLSLQIEFGATFEELKPSAKENPALEEAFKNNGTNYTLILQSASSSTDIAFYVTDTGILELHDYGSSSLTVGDYYYKKSGESYVKYQYNPGKVVTFEEIGNVSSIADIVPDFSIVSPAIFESLTSDTYVLLDAASTYVPNYLVPASYRMNDENGESASLTLGSDGKISAVDVTFYYGGEYITYNQSFVNRGETEYPSFFDDSISDFI